MGKFAFSLELFVFFLVVVGLFCFIVVLKTCLSFYILIIDLLFDGEVEIVK